MQKIKKINFDFFLFGSLIIILFFHFLNLFNENLDDFLLTFFSCIGTLPVLVSAYKSLINKKISVDLLAGIALIVSIFNKEWTSAVFINLMLTSARIFSIYIENRSHKALESLVKLRPKKVKIKVGNEIFIESISKVKEGDLIIVELGDYIPVDGVVESGQAEIDQSSLTGESIPVSKNIGDKVFSSTLNMSGSLVVKVEKVGQDTTFEKLVKLVENSQEDKIKIKTLADKFASWYIGFTFVVIIILYFFTRDLNLTLSVLLVTCADDIAVAIPMAFTVAIGSSAKKGIIVKGGEFFEILNKVKTILIDKTGTITKGKLKIESIHSISNFSEKEILKLAVISDCFSNHPVAKAITKYAEDLKIDFKNPVEFKEFPGMGSTAMYENKMIISGREKFLENMEVKISKEQRLQFKKEEQEGSSVLLISYDKKIIGYIKYGDEIKEESKKAILKMKESGIEKVVMLTGDNKFVAQKVAREVGIDIFHSNLLPEDKVKFVKEYIKKNNGKVAMIGDGINDAASLALSDVGIAMGVIGTDVAIEAADVALMKDDLSKISEVINLAKLVVKISYQDFFIWTVVNLIGLFLVFNGTLNPESASAYNFFSDFLPILNSLRLLKYRFK